MTWLFPLYLAGAAAVILPILLHLRRRPPKERVVFSSLMFLEPTQQVLTKRSKLERLLLLLLRCLALILLALMFARPFARGRSDQAQGRGEAVVLLLDTSASMRRGDLWKSALAIAEERVRKSKPEDRVAVLAFDRESKAVWPFDLDAQNGAVRAGQIASLLKPLKPGWAGTDAGRALVDAVASFQRINTNGKPPPAKKRIVLISDLPEGTKLDALRGFAWPDDVQLDVAQLAAPNLDNFSISLAATESEDESAPVAKAAPAAGVRVRISNTRDSKKESFSLQWDGDSEKLDGYLPAGASRVMRSPPEPKDGKARALALTGDAWDFDNRIFIAPPQPREARVLFLGDEASAKEAASPLYYLTRALQPTPSLRPIIDTASKDIATKLAGANIVFAQAGGLDDSAASALDAWTQQGGFAVLVLDAAKLPISVCDSLKVTEATGGDYAMLGDLDTAHPLLRPFADPRLRDFTKIRFWKHRKVEWAADDKSKPVVLAKFDNGDPALLLWNHDKGRLLVMASGWEPADSQLALSTKFVPLLFGWLEAAGFSHSEAQSLTVGDELPLESSPPLRGGSPSALVKVLQPSGAVIEWNASERAAPTPRATEPGLYTITSGTTTKIIAANLAPEEGRVHPMEPVKLAELGVKLAVETGSALGTAMPEDAADKQRLDAQEEESRQKMWLWVLVTLLGILAWETWLAGRRPKEAAVPA